MQTMQTIVSRNTYRIPPRLKLVLSRLSSLLLLFQRAPIVQFLFPEANIMGGGALANSFTLAVTTVVGLGAFDSVAGLSQISERVPLVVLGKTPSGTSPTSTTAINVPATVSAPLTFSFNWDPANDFSPVESWRCTTGGVVGTLPTGLSPAFNADSTGTVGVGTLITISGTPTATPGIYPVKINVYISPDYADETAAQIFNICVLGFSTQPVASTTISSGTTATLTCVAAGNPLAIPIVGSGPPAAQPAGTLTYQWYQGAVGVTTTPAPGASTSASYTTPALSTSTNYWVRLKSVLGASIVTADSTAAAVTVTTPPTVAVTPTGILSKTSPITFTLTFSQSVTGLTTGGITVTNGSKGTLSGSGTTYTLPVTPTGQGAVTCQVNAGAANGNTVSNTASVTYDSVAPTVAVTPTGTSTTNPPITFTLTFSEPVSGLAASGITVANGTKGTLSGSGTTYTLPVTPSSLGAVTCQVNAAAASDAATNTNTVSNTASVTYDTAYSSWASVLPPGQSGPTQTPQNDGVTNLEKFSFNMDPTKPDVRMLTVGGGGTAGLPGQAVVGGKLRLEFVRRKAGTNPGITYTAQFGSDLAGWVDIPVGTPAGTSIDATWERVTVDDPSGGTTRFGRVKIVQP